MWLLELGSLWSLWKYPKHLRGHLCEPSWSSNIFSTKGRLRRKAKMRFVVISIIQTTQPMFDIGANFFQWMLLSLSKWFIFSVKLPNHRMIYIHHHKIRIFTFLQFLGIFNAIEWILNEFELLLQSQNCASCSEPEINDWYISVANQT